MSDDRYITSVRYEDGVEVTSRYDKQTGLIFSTSVLPHPRPSLDELIEQVLDDDPGLVVECHLWLSPPYENRRLPMPLKYA